MYLPVTALFAMTELCWTANSRTLMPMVRLGSEEIKQLLAI